MNNHFNHLDLIDIYEILYTAAEHTPYSSEHGTFTKNEKIHMLGYKTSFKKFKGIKNMQSMFPDHHKIKLKNH